jgi:large subunit ribosomal protein L25
MNRILLKAENRELSSKGYLRQMRLAGRVPGVLYGHGGHAVPLSVESTELSKALHTSAGLNVLLNLELDTGAQEIAMIKSLERDVIKAGAFTHVDFVRISLTDKIEVSVPILITGDERRLVDGGVVAQPIREIIVLSSPGAIPEHFTVDVSGMVIGDSVTVADIVLPEGCELVTDVNEMIVNVMPPRVAQEAADEATAEDAVAEEEKPEE